MKQIIVGKCASAMQDDFKKAGKTPPSGMIDDTCGCIADGVLEGQGIDQAKVICVERSTAKYNS